MLRVRKTLDTSDMRDRQGPTSPLVFKHLLIMGSRVNEGAALRSNPLDPSPPAENKPEFVVYIQFSFNNLYS